jgi:hypothetical protein
MAFAPDLIELLLMLADEGVEVIVVGGFAAVAHGAPYVTFDLDLVHRRTPENADRLAALLPKLDAYARGRAPGERLVPGRDALLGPGHQLLNTRYGALDLLGTLEDDEGYDQLLPHTDVVTVRGRTLRIVSLAKLIDLKRRTNRNKDRLALPILEELARRKKP